MACRHFALVEEQALYDKFHLDEPWDSEHNLPLAKQMPNIYVDPSAPLEPGMTIFHAIVGENMSLKPDQPTRFSQFTDGTSNTAMIAEVNRSEAVPWSKPADIEIDLDNPAGTDGQHPSRRISCRHGGRLRSLHRKLDRS